MKVLFLDIDGVLNRAGTKERCDCGPFGGNWIGVDRELSDRLLSVLKDSDYQIVLSSTWRKDDRMFPHLNAAGIHWEHVTPNTGGFLSRGQEIKLWMDEHPEVTDYVILDDMDVLVSQKHRHVQTDERHGLDESKMAELVSLLGVPVSTTEDTTSGSNPQGPSAIAAP